MIRYIEGDIFKSPAQVLVNTVNTVGVMGKGIALEFKKRYPDMFQAYRDICDKRKLKTGSLMLCYEPDHWVLLFPTKEHWRKSLPDRIYRSRTGKILQNLCGEGNHIGSISAVGMRKRRTQLV